MTKGKLQPVVYYRQKRQGVRAKSRASTAAGAIGHLSKSTGFTLLTNGTFSMIDAVAHVLRHTGPADVLLTTWVPGPQEIVDLFDLTQAGNIRSLRLFVDRGFACVRPELAKFTGDLLGAENIVEGMNHSKVAIIRNEEWDFCLRGSLNLNSNPRCENIDGDNDAGMCDVFSALWGESRDVVGAGMGRPNRQVRAAYDSVMRMASPVRPGAVSRADRGDISRKLMPWER